MRRILARASMSSWAGIDCPVAQRYTLKKRMQRTGAISVLMADACSAVVREGFDGVLKAVQAKVPSAVSRPLHSATLQTCPLPVSSTPPTLAGK